MSFENEALLIKKVTNVLLGTYDFQDLARRAVDLILKELKEQDLIAAGVFRAHLQENFLYAYAYAAKYRKLVDKLLPNRFSDLKITLTSSEENLAVRTVVANEIQQSERLTDFSHGVLPDELTDRIQKLLKGKLAVSFPIRNRQGRAVGALLLLVKNSFLTGKQLTFFQTFADQLGLAFSNVSAFEKLLFRYNQIVTKDFLSEENVPNIKFTLRITPKQDKNLQRLAKENGLTKAEFFRNLIDRL